MQDQEQAVEVTAEGTEKKKAKPAAKRGKKKAATSVPSGCVFVHASYNNTIVTVTDPHGNVLGWSSAGVVGFKGPKKATPYAASVIVRDVMEKIKDVGLREAYVFVRGIGSGREAAVRALNANGVQVLAIRDQTPIPHNGCRAPRARRV
jgi:small subunit ribosomal protein S11